MERRKSLSYCGAADDDFSALHNHDSSFYGLNSDFESSSEDSYSDQEPPEKRSYFADDSSCDEDFDSGDESPTTEPADAAPVSASAGYIAAQIRENVESGCNCKTNHWELLPTDKLETLMVSLRDLGKPELKQFVLGELHALGHETKKSVSASSNAPASSARSWYYSFSVLGKPVCREVFSAVHGLSHHVLRKLQETAEKLEVLPPYQKNK